jgi:hypothetical protein
LLIADTLPLFQQSATVTNPHSIGNPQSEIRKQSAINTLNPQPEIRRSALRSQQSAIGRADCGSNVIQRTA